MSKSTSAEGAASGKKDVDLKCLACNDRLSRDDYDGVTLACLSGNVLCGECTTVFLKSVLAGGPSCLPVKCSVCRAALPPQSLERVLSKEQLMLYLTYVAMSTMDPGERVIACVHCNYMEIRSDEPALFYCRAAGCERVHCCTCKKVLKLPDEDVAGSDAEFVRQQDKLADHLSRYTLAKENKFFEEAIQNGGTVKCPRCGAAGRKDWQCCHMTCTDCNTEYCYVCGLSAELCDRGGHTSAQPLYAHNLHWETNPKRCPMYLSNLGSIDPDWDFKADFNESEEFDEDELENHAVAKFHRRKTLKELYQLKHVRLGVQKWAQLRGAFASVRNSGFTEREIDAAGDAPLFMRLGRDPAWVDESDGGSAGTPVDDSDGGSAGTPVDESDGGTAGAPVDESDGGSAGRTPQARLQEMRRSLFDFSELDELDEILDDEILESARAH